MRAEAHGWNEEDLTPLPAFLQRDAVSRRFRRVLDAVDEVIGDQIAQTPYRTENWFIPLFFVLYEALWPQTSIDRDQAPKRLSSGLTRRVVDAATKLSFAELPREVQDATRGAATDTLRRRIRFDFLSELVNG